MKWTLVQLKISNMSSNAVCVLLDGYVLCSGWISTWCRIKFAMAVHSLHTTSPCTTQQTWLQTICKGIATLWLDMATVITDWTKSIWMHILNNIILWSNQAHFQDVSFVLELPWDHFCPRSLQVRPQTGLSVRPVPAHWAIHPAVRQAIFSLSSSVLHRGIN